MNTDEKFRERFNNFFLNESSEIKVKYIQDEVHVESRTKLLGSKGLLNYLDIQYDTENFPEFPEKAVTEAYTGLIIDARHLEVNASLFPQVLTDKGLEIYSPSLVNKNFSIDNGFVMYMSDPVQAMKDKRVGENPYFILATNVTGKNKTKLTIPAKENYEKLYESSFENSLKEVSHDLVWDKMEGRKMCAVMLKASADFTNRADWSNQFEWYKEHLEKYTKYFKPRIVKI